MREANKAISIAYTFPGPAHCILKSFRNKPLSVESDVAPEKFEFRVLDPEIEPLTLFPFSDYFGPNHGSFS